MGTCWEMQNLRSHPRPTESRSAFHETHKRSVPQLQCCSMTSEGSLENDHPTSPTPSVLCVPGETPVNRPLSASNSDHQSIQEGNLHLQSVCVQGAKALLPGSPDTQRSPGRLRKIPQVAWPLTWVAGTELGFVPRPATLLPSTLLPPPPRGFCPTLERCCLSCPYRK